MASGQLHDTIGTTYTATRRADLGLRLLIA
jgi:hypothetical protein